MKISQDQYGTRSLRKVRQSGGSSRCSVLTTDYPAMEEGEGERAADRIALKAVPLGQKFYPSEYAFPISKSKILGVTSRSETACGCACY